MKTRRLVILGVLSAGLVSCAPAETNSVSSQIAENVRAGASCEGFSSKMTESLIQAVMDGEELPTQEDLSRDLQGKLGPGSLNAKLGAAVAESYRIAIEETRTVLKTQNKDELLEAIVGLEIGDETTPEKKILKGKLQKSYAAIQAAAQAAGYTCESTSLVSDAPAEDSDMGSILSFDTDSLPVKGAMKVMKTAYQSCQANRLPSMDASSIAIASGAIKVTGRHSNGVGQKREYGNIAQLVKSHYYIREGSEKAAGCFDTSTKPLIYDYGGKPYASSAATSTLDLFRDSGTGTSVLGIDCSGYVFSALATAGLRLSPGKKLTAYQVYGVNSRMMMNPAANGLSCLAPVKSEKTGTLQDGDILASTGHVVMVDQVGSDPFDIMRLKAASECKAANINFKNFDFDVLQSAPVKNAIGIDRMKASVYLAESSSMKAALVEYAVAACKARFGTVSTASPSLARLVRHKQTSECKDTAVKLERESCVASCL